MSGSRKRKWTELVAVYGRASVIIRSRSILCHIILNRFAGMTENAGRETKGRNCRTWNCRTWKCKTCKSKTCTADIVIVVIAVYHSNFIHSMSHIKLSEPPHIWQNVSELFWAKDNTVQSFLSLLSFHAYHLYIIYANTFSCFAFSCPAISCPEIRPFVSRPAISCPAFSALPFCCQWKYILLCCADCA